MNLSQISGLEIMKMVQMVCLNVASGECHQWMSFNALQRL
jgi:hypothetical protein